MKVVTAILLSTMILFLVQPFPARKSEVICAKCCPEQKNKKEMPETNSCNTFVNCCYRTFEVISPVAVKEITVVFNKQGFIMTGAPAVKGYIFPCWHPPRTVA